MVITIEEHTLIGGLGSACMELLVDSQSLTNIPPIYRMGLPDAFVQDYGDQDSLLEVYGLQPNQIAEKVFNLASENRPLQMVIEKDYSNG